ncbi:MAG: hypothetical protein ACRC92_22660 [Peptostreptococcaceae bacterium]
MNFVTKERDNELYCFVGPSGSGKNHLANMIVNSDLAQMFISATTRSSRKGETHGVDYYFMSKKQFDEHVENDEFFEHVEYTNASYGFFKSELNKLKKTPCIAIVTPDGARQLSKHVKNVKLIYIDTCVEERIKKTRERYGEDAHKYEEEIQKRIKNDEEVFGGFEKEENVYVFKNDYSPDAETKIQQLFLEIKYDLSANATVDRDLIREPISEIKEELK